MIISKTSSYLYKESLIALYVEAFSQGDSAQYINRTQLAHYIDLLLAQGYALIATEGETVCGALLACALTIDRDLPQSITEHYRPEKCLYLAEMMVAKTHRGQGVGRQLMEAFDQTADTNTFHDAFIRVWQNNLPALQLYLKNGYQPVATIEQQKIKPDGKTNFNMNKLYLHKILVEK